MTNDDALAMIDDRIAQIDAELIKLRVDMGGYHGDDLARVSSYMSAREATRAAWIVARRDIATR